MLTTTDHKAILGIALIAAVLVSLWTRTGVGERLSGPMPSGKSQHGVRINPVAALAWATAHCDSRLTLEGGTPRTHSDILYEVGARLDAEVTKRSLSDVCNDVLIIARGVTVTSSARETAPDHGGLTTTAAAGDH